MEEKTFNDAKPIIIQFENGCLKDSYKDKTSIKYLRHKAPRSNKRMLVVDTKNLSYTGNVLQKQLSFMKYYVGVIDKKTKKIEAIESCLHCNLKPKLNIVEKQDENQPDKKEYRQKVDNLIEAFGTAKSKRSLNARLKNEKVHATEAEKVGKVVQKIVEKTPLASPDTNTQSADIMSEILPARNENATTLDELYRIDGVITYQIYRTVRAHAQEIIDFTGDDLKKWSTEKTYSEFVLNHIRSLPENLQEREKRAAYLCYINYLIKFYKVKARQLYKKTWKELDDFPKDIKTILVDQFTETSDQGIKFLTKKSKDKTLCYIMVLALTIDHYELKCNVLLKDLELGVSKVSKLLRFIGCVVRNINHRKRKDDEGPVDPEFIATLLLPNNKSEPKTPIKPKAPKTPSKSLEQGADTPAKVKETTTTPANLKKVTPAKSNKVLESSVKVKKVLDSPIKSKKVPGTPRKRSANNSPTVQTPKKKIRKEPKSEPVE